MAILTPREVEVLKLICGRYSTKAIAAKLGISVKTAASHRSHILSKVGVHMQWGCFAGPSGTDMSGWNRPVSRIDAAAPRT
jgi:DNA-binding NarL/FixJ family response regulator